MGARFMQDAESADAAGDQVVSPEYGGHASPSFAVMAAYVAALDVASERQLSAVLQRLVDLARDVIPSRYAALGVADDDGRITDFITSGITSLERARIGPIPQGHGMLGALISDRQPMIVPSIADDPRSVGFPPNHPPMRSLLGVPLLLGDRVVGNLYLTERLGNQDYDTSDLEAIQILAAHAATAIDRARLLGLAQESRRQAEDQRDHLQVIIDSLPSGVMICAAPDGVVELANATARALAAEGPGPGRSHEFLRADGTALPRHQWPDVRALGGEVVRNRQLRIRFNEGHALPVLVESAPLRNRSGLVGRAVVVFQDITRLQEAEQLKDDFLSLISHEFRTPLTAIQGGANLLVQHPDSLDPETRHDLLADIVAESTKLEHMLANMLTVTEIQAGRLEPETEPVVIPLLVREAVAAARRRSPTHRFSFEETPTIPAAEGDPNLLHQILRNLYENAVKYSPPASMVSTTVDADGRTVTIHVTDQGSGIAPEHLQTVFERFRRPGADPGVRGMGLGLYLSRHLIEAQRGRISVTSPGRDKGATFSVTLPIATHWSRTD